MTTVFFFFFFFPSSGDLIVLFLKTAESLGSSRGGEGVVSLTTSASSEGFSAEN
uniref:Uncharacterized protein n=1 Tax=Arundo donax TaxID=35708 RepID=A0A0A8ZHA5_ARUDO